MPRGGGTSNGGVIGKVNNSSFGKNTVTSKKNILSKEEYTKKSDALRKKVIDYQSERRSSLDRIATQRTKAREALLEKLKPIIETHITENNISLVVDNRYSLGVIPDHDITKVIVEKLNKDLPSLNLK